MSNTQFGLEIDGNRVTIVEVLNDTAVSSRTVVMENLEDSISLLLAGVKSKDDEIKVRGILSIPKTAMRRIDITANLRNRKEFEDAVYNKLTVSRENTTVAGAFYRPELMEGDTISPGVAVVAPVEEVEKAYRAFGRKEVELVAPPLAYRGWDGLWLALRYETAELTLVKDNRAVAYRQMQIGGLNSIVGLLADSENSTIGYERLQTALTKTGLEDQIADSELDRYIRKVLNECQSTIRFWKQSGEEIGNEVFAFGPGAVTEFLEPAINEAGFVKVIPNYITKQLSFIPTGERDVAVSAWCAAISAGLDMPQASYINTSILEFKDKDQKKKLLKQVGLLSAGAVLLSLLFGGIPYLIGIKSKLDLNNDLEKVLITKSEMDKDIKLYNEIKVREQLVSSVRKVEPYWSEILNRSLTYMPKGGNFDSVQVQRDKNTISVTITATFKGDATNQISVWLDNIKTRGLAKDAWMTNFTIRNGVTNCQINYSLNLRDVLFYKDENKNVSDPNSNETSNQSTNPIVSTETVISTNQPGSTEGVKK